jgi:hypothetical protein
MNITTQHLLNNMAQADNCGWQTHGYCDSVFCCYNQELAGFAFIYFGMNIVGEHFYPVFISIVNSESKVTLNSSNVANIC